jgi:hypothetical protein
MKAALLSAQNKALALIGRIEELGLIRSGISEKELSQEILLLAQEEFNIKRFWHKRIVRAGENTLCPYDENPPNRMIQDDDILFIDLGPILEEWETDLGRTFVVGSDPVKKRLCADTAKLWSETNDYFHKNTFMRSSDLFNYIQRKSIEMGWEFGGEIAGHLIGKFPHEKISEDEFGNYIHPDNHAIIDTSLQSWILEIHLVDKKRKIGGFYEQLLVP